MRNRHLLTALAAWATLGFLSTMAQEPGRLPRADGGTVISDKVVSQDASYRGDHGALVVGPPHGGVAGAPGAGYPHAGYPYSQVWHAGYLHPMYGRPVALVVPPVSHFQTIYGWGIGATQIAPIYPQFDGPGYGTPYGDAGTYLTPPYWPSDTRQLGVYYVRGPW